MPVGIARLTAQCLDISLRACRMKEALRPKPSLMSKYWCLDHLIISVFLCLCPMHFHVCFSKCQVSKHSQSFTYCHLGLSTCINSVQSLHVQLHVLSIGWWVQPKVGTMISCVALRRLSGLGSLGSGLTRLLWAADGSLYPQSWWIFMCAVWVLSAWNKGWSCHNAACTYPVKTFVMPFAFAGRSFQLQSSVPCLDRETRESKAYADMLCTLRSQIFPNVWKTAVNVSCSCFVPQSIASDKG